MESTQSAKLDAISDYLQILDISDSYLESMWFHETKLIIENEDCDYAYLTTPEYL